MDPKPCSTKKKTVELSKGEADIYKNALALLAEEIAHVNHISRLKASNRIKAILKTGRSARQDAVIILFFQRVNCLYSTCDTFS